MGILHSQSVETQVKEIQGNGVYYLSSKTPGLRLPRPAKKSLFIRRNENAYSNVVEVWAAKREVRGHTPRLKSHVRGGRTHEYTSTGTFFKSNTERPNLRYPEKSPSTFLTVSLTQRYPTAWK